MQNKLALHLKSVSYMINNKKIINDISFQIELNDFVSIVGPNGSGKSTLIKLISGDILPTGGYIEILGKEQFDWDILDLAYRRSILGQFNNLSFAFTVMDVLKMGVYPLKNKTLKVNVDNVYEKLLKVFDLDDLKDQIYTTLSGGEKQRVQLARVISQIWTSNTFNNKLLILDEPTSFLDIKHQLSLFSFLKDLNRKGLTIVMVMHDINQAVVNSNKIMFLKEGQMIDFGSTDLVVNDSILKEVFDVNFNIEYLKNTQTFI